MIYITTTGTTTIVVLCGMISWGQKEKKKRQTGAQRSRKASTHGGTVGRAITLEETCVVTWKNVICSEC